MMNSDVLTSDTFDLPTGFKYLANDGGGTYTPNNFKCVGDGYCDLTGQNGY